MQLFGDNTLGCPPLRIGETLRPLGELRLLAVDLCLPRSARPPRPQAISSEGPMAGDNFIRGVRTAADDLRRDVWPCPKVVLTARNGRPGLNSTAFGFSTEPAGLGYERCPLLWWSDVSSCSSLGS